MKQPITGFHQDHEHHWVAELACGHGQHTRHDPPWVVREWVTTPEGRSSRLGEELNCVRCDEAAEKVGKAVVAEARKALLEAYESAGMSGLCGDGRWEAALGALSGLDVRRIGESALR